MKKVLSTVRLTSATTHISLKCLLTCSLVAALSGCGSLQYNGISEADTIFDIFSFAEDEPSEQSIAEAKAAEKAAKQREQMHEQQQAKLAEQPGSDTYQRLAQGTAQQEARMDKVAATSTVAQPTAEAPANLPVSEETLAAQQPVESNDAAVPVAPVLVATTDSADTSEINQTTVLVSAAEPEAASQATPVVPGDISESRETDVAAVEEINQLTEQNPTAAMVSDYQVLPEVSKETELSVPNEILLLATPAEYRPEISEYGMWKIAKGDESLYRENCTLASATMQVSFDNYSTQIWLNVVGDDLLVNSTTNLDITRPRVGIKLDNGPLQPFTKKHFGTSAVWAGDLNAALNNNKKMSVILSGNEIGNRIQEVSVELDELKRAYAEYSKCNATTQVGSL